jgi:hypothetical protein
LFGVTHSLADNGGDRAKFYHDAPTPKLTNLSETDSGSFGNQLICPTGKSVERFSPLAMRRYLDHLLDSPARKNEFRKRLQCVSPFQGLAAK